MPKINELLKRIKLFLKKILEKNEQLLLDETNKEEPVEIINSEDDKKRIFKIYENVKKGVISLDDLIITDLIKVLMISQEELKIHDNKANKLKEDLLNINLEYNFLIEEKKRLKNM